MGFGKMDTFVDVFSTEPVKDPEGFSYIRDTILATVHAYREDQHGSERWSNMAAFSEATSLFRFRKIPGLEITTAHVLVCDTGRYNIVSVEDVKGRGMYIEALATKKAVGSSG